jgi:hypothetical protein
MEEEKQLFKVFFTAQSVVRLVRFLFLDHVVSSVALIHAPVVPLLFFKVFWLLREMLLLIIGVGIVLIH